MLGLIACRALFAISSLVIFGLTSAFQYIVSDILLFLLLVLLGTVTLSTKYLQGRFVGRIAITETLELLPFVLQVLVAVLLVHSEAANQLSLVPAMVCLQMLLEVVTLAHMLGLLLFVFLIVFPLNLASRDRICIIIVTFAHLTIVAYLTILNRYFKSTDVLKKPEQSSQDLKLQDIKSGPMIIGPANHDINYPTGRRSDEFLTMIEHQTQAATKRNSLRELSISPNLQNLRLINDLSPATQHNALSLFRMKSSRNEDFESMSMPLGMLCMTGREG